jgi:hypothetical protein
MRLFKSTRVYRERPITGRPGYKIREDGYVFSQVEQTTNGPALSGIWRLIKPTPQERGHLSVTLGQGDTRYVHRLVLEAFVGPCPEGMECRHLNGVPADNRLENLRRGTPKENHGDSVRHGTAAHRKPGWRPRGRVSLTAAQVEEIRAKVPAAPSGVPQELAERFGVSAAFVRAIARGARTTAERSS